MSRPSEYRVLRSADRPVEGDAFAAQLSDMLDAVLTAHSGSLAPSYAAIGTVWHEATTEQIFLRQSAGDVPLVQIVAAPTAASDPGAPGQIAYDGSFLYICVAPDTWLRAALANW